MLRRLVYLGIKELANIAEDVIIVTSSLTKDMTGKEDNYRAAAIRALCTITDPVMLQAIERYMKQAIVDRNPAVSTAALVSSLHLSATAPEVVKRWVNEVQESLSSDNVMVQYHALGLLYHIRKQDRLAITKLLAKLTKMSLKSPYAVILLIRIACKMIEEEDGDSSSPYFDFVESCLRHKSEMVIYEAAHAIVNMKKTTSRSLMKYVNCPQFHACCYNQGACPRCVSVAAVLFLPQTYLALCSCAHPQQGEAYLNLGSLMASGDIIVAGCNDPPSGGDRLQP